MSENNQKSTDAHSEQPAEAKPADATADQDNIATALKTVLTKPDVFFSEHYHGQKLFGLISAGLFIGLIFFQSLLSRTIRWWSRGFEFGYITQSLSVAIAIGVPVVAALFVFKMLAGKYQKAYTLDFFIEKFGAALILPALLLIITLPLNLIGATIGNWTRAAALIMVYVIVFHICYRFAAPNRLVPAVLLTLGYYFAYRLMLLLL